MVVAVYRINSGLSNVTDSISLEKPDSDVIYNEIRLELPVGFEVGNNAMGQPAIYDRDGEHYDLVLNNLRGTAVIAVGRNNMIGLKIVNDNKKTIPLTDARINANLTRKQLSEISGVSIRLIQRLELGESEAKNMTAQNLLALADALGVDPRSLI